MDETIKAIIFDFGGVIYVGKQRANSFVPEMLKVNKEVWEKSTGEIWENLNLGKIEEDAGLVKMASNLKINKDRLKKLWIKAFKTRFILNKDLLGIIKKLRRNYKTAILSNIWAMPCRLMLTKKIKSNFDVRVLSHEVGYRKPAVEIYNIVFKQLHLKPSECIFIDDFKENLIPAQKLGMKTILFKNNQQLLDDLNKFGVKI